MKTKLAGVIFLFSLFVSAAYGTEVSVETRQKLEQFMRRIIIQKVTYSIKRHVSGNNFEIDLASFKMTNTDKTVEGTGNRYSIKGEYVDVTRAKEDIYSNGKIMQHRGTSLNGDKHFFKAEVLEKGVGQFQINAFTEQTE